MFPDGASAFRAHHAIFSCLQKKKERKDGSLLDNLYLFPNPVSFSVKLHLNILGFHSSLPKGPNELKSLGNTVLKKIFDANLFDTIYIVYNIYLLNKL